MSRKIYKTVDLFGAEQIQFVEGKAIKKPDLFSDHDAFVEKFEVKKTTDDCYTPPDIFNIILDYVRENCDMEGKQIIRPFYPGGDFEHIEYPDDCVIIDNPPFSIISKIAQFYIARGIPFFLFAPHLTLFSPDINCTHIVCAGDITYGNGATVKTSFLSNMFGNAKVIGAADLFQKFKNYNEGKKANLPKYVYPNEVLTVSMVSWIIERGISLRIDKGDTAHCRGLDSQKTHKKCIFGSGFLLSSSAAAEKAAAEKAAAEKENVIVWELSAKERKIIDSLGN